MALERLDRELEEYLSSLTDVLGRSDRRSSAKWYVTGLLLDGDRKSLAPMAARLVDDPHTADAMRQRLQECVVISPWSDDALRERLARKVVDELPKLAALVIDDTGFPKKGIHSVAVQRQYSGTLGRRDNCQVATSLHVAGERGSACIAMRLYLPESWTQDAARCRKAGVPDEVEFQTKWQLALAALDDAARWDVPKYPVLADAGYGDVGEFRSGLHDRGYDYVLGVQGTHIVWAPAPCPHRLAPRPVVVDQLHAGSLATRSPSPCASSRSSEVAPRVVSSDGGRARLDSNAPSSVQFASAPRTDMSAATLPASSNGFFTSGRRASPSQRSTGYRRCPPRHRSRGSCAWPSCGGASSGTTRR